MLSIKLDLETVLVQIRHMPSPELNRSLGTRWNTMTAAERAPFVQAAAQLRGSPQPPSPRRPTPRPAPVSPQRSALRQLYLMSCAVQQHLAEALLQTAVQPSAVSTAAAAQEASMQPVLAPPNLEEQLLGWSTETDEDDELTKSISTWMSESHHTLDLQPLSPAPWESLLDTDMQTNPFK